MTFSILLLMTTPVFGQNLRSIYKNTVKEGLKRTSGVASERIVMEDLSHLPALVQNYLITTGVLGQEHVRNVKIVFKGRMRSNPGDPWMHFTSEQYNFFDQPTRAFYIKARKMGIPANGLHLYKEEEAYMKIRLAGLIPIIDVAGSEMDESETVTFLNDICFFAPAVLVDMHNLSWEETGRDRVRVKYKNGKQEITATLIFNEEGMLSNFISDDRWELVGKEFQKRPWYTPVEEYGEFGGHSLPAKAGAWYKRPDQEFCYGEFTTVEVVYNVDLNPEVPGI